MYIRNALPEEAAVCYSFIEAARQYHKQQGFVQWHPDYPTLQIIERDIAEGVGYVFVEDNQLLGYCCLIIGDEPAYDDIDGAWANDVPYAVIHRMAFGESARGKGISKAAFRLLKQICKSRDIFSIRVDTQSENKIMRHILEREGFKYCGLVQFDGGSKLAYELDF